MDEVIMQEVNMKVFFSVIGWHIGPVRLERRTAISACRFQDNKKLNGTEHLEYRKEICTEIYEISALIWHTQYKTKSIKETA